jgi:cation diffusion facilitator family transporter
VALAVNLGCALLLNVGHEHPHEHGHGHHEHGRGEDLNLRAAYLHVLADAMTTLAAICALLAGKYFGWSWLDPVVGLAGSAVIFSWAYGLLRATSGILLDRTPETSDLPEAMRQAVENDGGSVITDLHIWQVSTGKFAAIVSIAASEPKHLDHYRDLFREHEELVHVTVEVRQGGEGNGKD